MAILKGLRKKYYKWDIKDTKRAIKAVTKMNNRLKKQVKQRTYKGVKLSKKEFDRVKGDTVREIEKNNALIEKYKTMLVVAKVKLKKLM